MIRIYGIIYGDKKTEYTPFVNKSTEKMWRFENSPMIQISDTLLSDLDNNDLVGVLSHKFKYKTSLSKMKVYRFLKDAPKSDVYNFCRMHARHIHFMDWSNEGHKGIKSMIQRCCKHVGMEYTNDPKHIIYANQFISTKHVYTSYINQVIKPCLELLEGEMWEEVNRDAGYTRAMESSLLKKYTGLDFYNYIPFILERMMSQFIYNRNLICTEYYRR